MSESDKIYLEIITPEGEVLHCMAESVSVPAVMGSTGILANHAPLLTVLTTGVVSYRCDGSEHLLAIGGGFMEVINNKAQLLVKTCEKEEDIDVDRAEAAAERARKRLADANANIDRARAEAALARASTRLRVAHKL